jgi:hypothetical protein
VPQEETPSWLSIEERDDGPQGFRWAVVIRGDVATWCASRENAEVMRRALTQAWLTELTLETRELMEDADLDHPD